MSKILCWSVSPGLGWFRVFGYGLWWKDTKRHRLLFSQRMNLAKYVRVGNWVVEFLRPCSP